MGARSSAGGTRKGAGAPDGFSEQERKAMRERAAELRVQAGRGRGRDKAAAEEADVLAKIGRASCRERV